MLEEQEKEIQENTSENGTLESGETAQQSKETPEIPKESTAIASEEEVEKAAPENEELVEPQESDTSITPKEVENSEEIAKKDAPESEEVAGLQESDTSVTAKKAEDSEEIVEKDAPKKEEVAELQESDTSATPKKAEDSEEEEEVLEEIDESNAEDAEDTDNHHRHHIPFLDYHSMTIENLTGELQKLVRNEKIQAIKKHVDSIKHEFDLKFQEFIDGKKEDFIAKGGNEIDFRYNSVTKRQFNEVYGEYREKRNQYYKNLEKSLKDNLGKRLEIIEELKGLVNVEEDMNTTYKNFKGVQERWRNAGPIPRTHYNNVWKTYQHHIEIFYDFLSLNRELRDLDFKHNLEEKEKIVTKAEALATEPDLGKAFRELQTLHKVWKEDIGPVGKEHREEIWERFSKATKVLHQRRQDHYKDLEAKYEENLVKKKEIIANINAVAANVADNHKLLQQQIKEIEAQRNAFFKAGKVPQKVNEKTWAAFKDAVRAFNRNKNAYYKNLKKEQQENLDKKRALLALAISFKDSEEGESATQEMKRIQSEWKKIGHVPRKYSDKIWKEFKEACNHYFNRLHAKKNEAQQGEIENLKKKEACLEQLRTFELSGNREKDLAALKKFIDEWKNYGRVPFHKKSINQKFNKIVDAIFRKLDVSRQESELLKYGNKIQQLAKDDNERAISNERTFIRRKIEESKNEMRQLENNLQFFSNASEDNPLVKDVIQKVQNHKDALATWKEKLKKLNIMENNRNKEVIEGDSSEEE